MVSMETMHLSAQRLSFCLVTLGVAFLASACGDDEGSSSSTSSGGAGGSGQGGFGGLGLGGLDVGGSGTGASGTGGSAPSCEGDLMGGDGAWARGYGSGATVTDMAVDAAGNTLVTGSYQGTLTVGTDVLNSNGTDVFLAKFGPGGQPLWAKSFGGNNTQVAQAVTFDGAGNAIVVGNFLGTINFGGGNLNSPGCCFEDLFIAKLDADGNYVWAFQFGDGDVERAKEVTVNGSDEIFVTGEYKSSLDFGDGGIADTGGDFNIFVAKLSAGGAGIWSASFGDGVAQDGEAIAVDGNGDVIVAGDFEGELSLGTTTLTAPGDQSMFVAKLSGQNGSPIWASSFGDDSASAVAASVDAQGNAFVGGSYRGSIDFGDGDMTSGNGDDVFVLKFEPGGEVSWWHSYGSSSPQTLGGLAATPAGDAFVAGGFAGDIDLGGGTLTSGGGGDVYVGRLLAADGCPQYQAAYGGAGEQSAQALAVNAAGEAFVAGTFTDSIDFGTGPVTAAATDLFVAKLNP